MHLALSGMQAGTKVDAEWPQLVDDRLRAADAARRAVEGREEAVSHGLDLVAAEALERAAGRRRSWRSSTSRHRRSPRSRGPPGGIDDVGEEHRGEHPIGSRAGRVPVRNSSISSMTASPSPIHGQWSPPGNSTYLAPGMCSARYRLCSTRTQVSSARWRMSVGTRREGRRSRMSRSRSPAIISRALPRAGGEALNVAEPPPVGLVLGGAGVNPARDCVGSPTASVPAQDSSNNSRGQPAG